VSRSAILSRTKVSGLYELGGMLDEDRPMNACRERLPTAAALRSTNWLAMVFRGVMHVAQG